jgi:hypothetical protein
MAYNAEQTADRAEADNTNVPGYCLQWSREKAGIASKYDDASTAWRNTNDRHPGDRNPPRGSMVYWTGGSHGYGHIAPSVGGGKVRSTDAGGSGRVATVSIDWPTQHWGLPYAGWAWDVNEVTIPHDSGTSGKDDDDVALTESDIQDIARRVVEAMGDYDKAGKVIPKYADNPSTGNQRLRSVASIVQRIEAKVDKLSGK